MCKKWKVFIMVFCLIFTMMPMTAMAAAAPDATLTLYYLDKNESGDAAYIDIDTVEYTNNDNGEPVKNGHIIPVYFGDEEKVEISVEDYVPDLIKDTKGIIWEINDAGAGQQKIQINKNSLKDDKNVIQEYHYKKGECEPPAVTQGGITITKVVTGDRPSSAATFTFAITGPDDYSGRASITGEGDTTLNNLEPGAYTITEGIIDNYAPKLNDQVVNVVAGTVAAISFENVYTEPENPPSATSGSIKITKVVTGDRPSSAATFTFAITGTNDYSGRASITGEGDTTLNNLEPGAYTITEGIIDNYAPKLNDQVVNVVAGTVAAISFENVYSEPYNPPSATSGSITIRKVITGDVPAADDVFTFTVTMSDAYSSTVTITGAGVTTISGLIPGSYTVTEDTIDNYEADQYTRTARVTAGGDSPVEFTNYYSDPEDVPKAFIIKTVALYDGTNIPSDSAFANSLTLSELNKTVIFKIDLSCNSWWNHYEKAAGLFDFYNNEDITSNLLATSGGALCKAVDVESNYFPEYLWIDHDEPSTYYYIDTLTSNGTYTNTAYLYESMYYRATSETPQYPDAFASSSAVVVVNYIPPTDNGGGGSSHSHSYYYVTYDANFPVSTGTSGTVPVDNSKYSNGATVTVKDNSGDLKAGDYTFEGWNTRADGTGTAYDPEDTFKISSSVTLYAQWKNGNTLLPDDNGEAAATSEVVPVNQLDDVPKTGDSAPLFPMMLLGALSAAVLLMFGRNKTADQK